MGVGFPDVLSEGARGQRKEGGRLWTFYSLSLSGSGAQSLPFPTNHCFIDGGTPILKCRRLIKLESYLLSTPLPHGTVWMVKLVLG